MTTPRSPRSARSSASPRLGLYAEVLNAYMEEEPLIANGTNYATQPNVVVVPFFISDGLHSYEDIPVLLGIAEESPGAASASQQEVFRRNPYHLRGRTLYYASAIGTEPLFADVILEQVAAFDARHASRRPDARSHQDTRTTGWSSGGGEIGEIAIVRADGGFELRHRDDRRTRRICAPHRARKRRGTSRIYDDAGSFRPLKTAPNLRHGWRLRVADLRELRRALDYFYPAMLGVWLQPLRAANSRRCRCATRSAGRPGMYRVTQKITDEQAQDLIGGFCRSDGGCLKHILWRIAPDLPITSLPAEKLHPPPAGAALPLLCHEACNLLVAEAREW